MKAYSLVVVHRVSSMATLALLLLQTQMQCSVGFSTATISTTSCRALPQILPHLPRYTRIDTAINSETQTTAFIDGAWADDEEAVNGLPTLTGALLNAEVHQFDLKHHKPLGCSVEESLASEPDGAKYVFVTQINGGGNAEKAGFEVGDVIVQISGTFDDVVDVKGMGLDKVRSLVAGRAEESPLVIRVARGSDVIERHEMAIVDLCILGDDKETEECITSIYKADDDIYIAGDSEMAMCEDDGTECMLDSMWGAWSEGLPMPGNEEEEEEEVKVKKKKVAPWSSRSSPSGTYVRDPKTGIMENIDE